MKRASTAPKVKKSATPKTAPKSAAVKERAELEKFISASLDSDKAKDIVAIDLKGKTAIADFLLIATGTSPPRSSMDVPYVS